MTLLLIKVTEPVVVRLRLVKVLLLIVLFRWVLALVINVIAPEAAATVCPNVLKLLLLATNELRVLAEPEGCVMPTIEPATTALCRDILLLLTVVVKAVVGAVLAAGI